MLNGPKGNVLISGSLVMVDQLIRIRDSFTFGGEECSRCGFGSEDSVT